MRHILILLSIKLKRRLNCRYSLKSDQIETYYQTEVYSHSYQNHVIQNILYFLYQDSFYKAVWDYYDMESLRDKKVTHFIRSHRTTFLPPIATFQS